MLRLTNTNLYLIGVIVLLAVVSLYLYTSSSKSSNEGQEGYEPKKREHDMAIPPPSPQPIVENSNLPKGMENRPCLALLHADWCPHCKDLLPDWENVKKAVGGRHLLADIESKNPLMTTFADLKGFPTIRYFPQGLNNPSQYIEYEGDRTADSILIFLQQNSQKNN